MGWAWVHAHAHVFPVRTNIGIKDKGETLLRGFWKKGNGIVEGKCPHVRCSRFLYEKHNWILDILPKYCLSRGGKS